MNAQNKAKLTALSRAEMIRRIVDLRQPVAQVAAGFGVSVRTAFKWLARWGSAEACPARRATSRLGKAFLQQSQRPKPALLQRFESTSCSQAQEAHSQPATCHSIPQCSIEKIC